jgi:signal transduction histidine kinase/CheY-like chemotaxis protein/HAMP domain-containing protein
MRRIKRIGKFGYADSIRKTLIRVFALLIIIPIILLGSYSYIVARNNLIEQTKIAMIGNVDVISYGIENGVKKENDVVKFFSYEDDFRKALERVSIDPYTLTEELNDEIEPLIWYYLSSDTNIESITIYSDLIDGEHMGDFLLKPVTDKEQEWYEETGHEYGAYWDVDDEGGVYLIKALLDSATSSKRIGMIALKVKESEFFSIVNKSGYLNNGIIILDRRGKTINHRKIDNSDLEERILENIRTGEVEGFHATSEYFIAESEDTANGWTLYYYVDRNEITADVYSILLSVIVIAVVLFLAAFIFGQRFANKFGKRIARINDMAHEIEKGNFDVKNHDDHIDELGQLSDSMESMAITLNNMVKEIDKMNKEQLMLKDNDIHYREWLFDFVVEKNNDILAVISGDGYAPSFITANAETVLGIPMDELKEDIRNLVKAQRVGEEKRLSEGFEDVRKTGETQIFDEIRFENVKTNEHLYYRGVIVSTIDDGGKRMAVALYDRTQEFRRNHQLQEALSAAETANKAKTSFLANMSHDFRTPMNAITGFNLLIDKHADEPDKVKEYTYKISLASHNLLALLNDVLDMSKIESGKTTLDIQEMAIGLLLEEINSVISFQAKAKDQTYTVKIENMQHDIFMADKQRVNEILMNILGNAVKYTPEGGKIDFTISESDSSSEGFQNVKFTIADNGIGMKPEYKDKIFDAFSREEKGATKTIQGTGLGMAITKSLVELMGGTIRVESEEGKGSTFIVNLRLKAVETKNVDFWKAHGMQTLLTVNGSMSDDKVYKQKYKNDLLDSTVATGGYEALKLVEEMAAEGKAYDLIIVDENYDDMEPAELIRNIRKKDKSHHSVILAVTDFFEKNEDALREAGCNEVMQKPVLPYNLRSTIDRIAKIETGPEEEPKNPLEGMKFLAAEDNDINADILIELMDMYGAKVTRGVNGQEVVEMFKAANEGDYDMILMDIQMPVMNGYEAAAAIRALGTDWAQRIPIIAMTANAYADDVQQAFDAGMNAHVTKPIDIKVVEKTISEFKK